MPKCFAIMPITTPTDAVGRYGGDADHFLHVAQYLFKPAVESAGFKFVPPAVAGSDLIQAQIIENLESADLVLCDMSCWNANVFFELGIRVALDKPVAMVRDSLTVDIPFDNVPVNCHTYDWRMEQWNVEVELPKIRKFIYDSGTQKQNALWKYFGITQRAQHTDPGNPEEAKLDLILARLANLESKAGPDGINAFRQKIVMPSPWADHKIQNFDLKVKDISPELGVRDYDASAQRIVVSGPASFSATDEIRQAALEVFGPDVHVEFFTQG